MSKKSKSILGLLGLALLAVLLVYSNQTSAQEVQKVQQFAIPTDALSENVRVLSQEMGEKTDEFHPLNTASTSSEADSRNRAALFDYSNVYATSLLFTEQGVMIGNFVYQYDSYEAAQEAASLLKRDLRAALSLVTESETNFILQGDEDDIIEWYIMPKEDTLVLIVANGMEAKSVEETLAYVLSLLKS
jgi:hypothetical protein